jgi:hypothetical protein
LHPVYAFDPEPAGVSPGDNIDFLPMEHFEALRKISREKLRENRRLILALACYLVLIILALVVFLPVRTSDERFALWLVLAVFAILIVKTIRSRDK